MRKTQRPVGGSAKQYGTQVEEELRRSEERFRLLIQNSRDVISVLSPEGALIYQSPSIEQILGYRPEERIGKNVFESPLVHPEDLALKRDFLERAAKSDPEVEVKGEFRLRHADGSYRHIEAIATNLLHEPAVSGIIANYRDVTERKRDEEALRTSHRELAYLKFAIDESAIVAFTDQKGKITYVNEKFCQISKYSKEELLGQDHRIINSGYHEKEYIRNLWRTIAQGRVWRGELRNRAKDGSIYWVDTTIVPFLDERSKPYRYVAIRHDVTSRKLAEERLQDTLQRLLALYEGAQVLGSSLKREEIGTKLLETMRRASGLYAAVIELQEEDQGGLRALCEVGPEDLLHKVRSASESEVARRAAFTNGERRSFKLHSPSGANEEPLWGLCLPLRVRERSIGVVEAYGPKDLIKPEAAETLGGLTNQAASALENARLYEELSTRARHLRQLVGQILKAQEEERRRVAYEIHDGLAQVAAAAHQYLQGFAKRYSPESASGKEELREALELIQQAVREARHVISNLRPTALDDFGLARALRMHAEELSVAEELQVSYEETLGDQRLSQETETTLFRIAQEALTNARKHAGSPQVLVKLERLNQCVRLEVRDWGEGFKVEEATDGSGGPGERVGISGMRERVAVIGGKLRIESQPGAGTTIMAEVPLTTEEETNGGG